MVDSEYITDNYKSSKLSIKLVPDYLKTKTCKNHFLKVTVPNKVWF